MTDKKIQVKEFKTFIEACEFVTDSDTWVPSEKQWKRIRQMIDNLEEPINVVNNQYIPQQNFAYGPPPTLNQPDMMNIDQSLLMAPPSSVPNVSLAGKPFATAPNQPVRAPDIDTSNGQYKSTFV